jgi:hypothetical protein
MATETVILNCARLEPSLEAIDYIARLRVGLRLGGCALCLANTSPGLRELIDLAGLAAVLGVQVQRQAEQREEPGGVQEEGDLSDPPA